MDRDTNEDRQEDELQFLKEVYDAIDLRSDDPWKVRVKIMYMLKQQFIIYIYGGIYIMNSWLKLCIMPWQVRRPPEYSIELHTDDTGTCPSLKLKVRYPVNYPDEWVTPSLKIFVLIKY